MITKEKFLEKCVCLFSEYDFSNIDWVDYNTPIIVLCKKHGNFEIPPRKLYQQRGRCPNAILSYYLKYCLKMLNKD